MKTAQEILKSHDKFIIKLGLERIEKILSLLNNPQNNYKIIHIAGTNGKGSTSKIINDILIEANYKTGLYTSPHLFSYVERIKVNNENISDYVFNQLINKIDELAIKNSIQLSEFELLTATAFYYFYIKQVDYVVLETGLGGLYDATNIIKNPDACVITTIDFDHTERLGSTIEEIAAQKAGIIKENSRVIINENNLGYETIKKYIKDKNAQLIPLKQIKVNFNNNENKNYAIFNNKQYEFNLLGSHQAENLALAYGAIKHLKISDEIIEKALKKVSWQYRMEFYKDKNILIDCAHNPNGILALRNFLDENFKDTKKRFIFGCLKNKDYNKMLDILIKEEDELFLIEYDYPNSLKFEELDNKYHAKKINEIKDGINENYLNIICGSIYMLGEKLKNYFL